jgi:excinuclease ABC subunit C
MNRDLQARLDALPPRPGVYLYRNATGDLLYVGKAKSLRSRVRSYFQPSAKHAPRTAGMVAEIAELEFIVVDSEMEALILESNLIKRHKPPYNIVLRDDKSYPYLRLSLEDEYPRISLVRKIRPGRSRYYGPFLPASVAHRTMKMVPRFFRVAACKEVFDGRRRPCLYYHLDQCLAPCAGRTDPEEYGKAVHDTRLFLEGNHDDLRASLERRMQAASDDLNFEAAARYRDTLRTLDGIAGRQRMSSVGMEEQDYLSHHAEGGEVVLQLFQVRDGKVSGRREFAFESVDPDRRRFYAAVLAQYYADVEPPPEIFLPCAPSGREVVEEWLSGRRGKRVRIRTPRKGPKKRLLDLVARNAAISFESRFRAAHSHGVKVLEALAEVLGLEEPPFRIECFDISNIQGSDSVASLVVWEGGKPRKSEYRTFTIRAVEGPDDYASMSEAVTRRYRRRIQEDRRLPDLVLIDGGPGQLGAAVRSLAEVGLPTLPVVSLAKREEEIHLHRGDEPVRLRRNSPALHLVQRIRDEAHRFAVLHHRRKRSRRTLRTSLTEVPGIGPVTARKLLKRFGSVKGVRGATREELEKVAGRKVAEALVARYGGSDGGNGNPDS